MNPLYVPIPIPHRDRYYDAPPYEWPQVEWWAWPLGIVVVVAALFALWWTLETVLDHTTRRARDKRAEIHANMARALRAAANPPKPPAPTWEPYPQADYDPYTSDEPEDYR